MRGNGGRIPVLSLLLATIAATAACSRGGGGSHPARGELRFTDFAAPTAVASGQEARVTFGLLSTVARKRTAVTLELIPRPPDFEDLEDLDPSDVGYEGYEVTGLTLENIAAGEERRVEAVFEISDEIPTGTYVPVLRANKFDFFGRDGKKPPKGGSAVASAPYIAATNLLEIVEPDLVDIRIVSLEPAAAAFRLSESPGIGPLVEGAPESGDHEIEEDFSASLVLTADALPATDPITVVFDLGIPDGAGDYDWYALEVIDRQDGAAGTDTDTEFVLDPAPETGHSLAAGERRGFTADFLVPQAARDVLLALEPDTACLLRATVDPADDHDEWAEDASAEDNTRTVVVVHLGSDSPDDPSGSMLRGPERPEEPLEPGVRETAILGDPRLSFDNRHPLSAALWESESTYGDKGMIAVGYHLGASLSYAASTFIPLSGRKVSLMSLGPSAPGGFVKAENAGGGISTYNPWVGGWEQFTLEVVSRNVSVYQVRFKSSSGVHYLTFEAGQLYAFPSGTAKLSFRNDGTSPAITTFELTDENGDELVNGDTFSLTQTVGVVKRPVIATTFGPGVRVTHPASDASKFRIVDSDPSSTPRKVKYITDNYADFSVFNLTVTLLKVAAGAELDSEDLPRTFLDWEVRVLGLRLWGDFVGVEMDGDSPKVKDLLTTGDRFVKSTEKKGQSLFWVGPVPITVKAGGKGSLGFKAAVSIQTNNRLVADAGPFIEFTAFVSAGLDVGFASASVIGELTILKVDLKFKATLQIAVGTSIFKFTLSAPLTFSSMGGKIFLRVEWDLWITKGKEDFDIVSWKGWTKTYDLFKPAVWQW